MRKLLFVTLLFSNLVYAQSLLKEKFDPQILMGSELSILTSNNFENIPLFNNETMNYKLELNTSYLDVGYLYMKCNDVRQLDGADLSENISRNGVYLDVKLPKIINAISKKQSANSNYFFIRGLSMSSESISEDYKDILQTVWAWTINGEFVPPGTEGAIPAFEPVFMEFPIEQLVELSNNYTKKSLGIGYSYTRSFFNLKSVMLVSEYEIDYQFYNENTLFMEKATANDWTYELQLSLSVNINNFYEEIFNKE
jgi:hypothetical protein